jgi:hypothetical protein
MQLNSGEFGAQASAISACSEESTAGANLRSMVLLRHHFTSVATSFSRDIFDKVTRHASIAYYENPSEYIAAEYGDHVKSPSGDEMTSAQFTEQDGLLNRDELTQGLWTLSPRCPRAFHAGFSGYNRLLPGTDKGGSQAGATFREKYDELATMSADEMIARATAISNKIREQEHQEACENCGDVVPVPLDGYYATQLILCNEVTNRDQDDVAAGQCADPNWPLVLTAEKKALMKEYSATEAREIEHYNTVGHECIGHGDGKPESFWEGRDIRGYDLKFEPEPAKSAKECCFRCLRHNDLSATCGGWVWVVPHGDCYLKDHSVRETNLVANGGVVAGILG